MTDPENPETTAGGAVGRVVGKLKSAVGSLVGNEDLAREGNLQQAQVEAEADAVEGREAAELRRQEAVVVEQRAAAAAERERLEAELDAEADKDRVAKEAARREREIEVEAAREQAVIRERDAAQQAVAESTEETALRRRAQRAAEAARLEQEAKNAEMIANTIDPEAK